MSMALRATLAMLALAALPACDPPLQATAQAKIVQVARFGDDKAPTLTDVELTFECPADVRRLLRLDANESACGLAWKVGDTLPVELVSTRSGERGTYQSQVVRIGNCAVHPDPNDTANYELVQECRPLDISGATVGVTCDRRRSAALLKACPFLRR